MAYFNDIYTTKEVINIPSKFFFSFKYKSFFSKIYEFIGLLNLFSKHFNIKIFMIVMGLFGQVFDVTVVFNVQKT